MNRTDLPLLLALIVLAAIWYVAYQPPAPEFDHRAVYEQKLDLGPRPPTAPPP